MTGKDTFFRISREDAIKHTQLRLIQRYGITATDHDYDILVDRVKSAIGQISAQEGLHRLSTNLVFDVEFPGQMVRVAYNRIDGLIRTALPMDDEHGQVDAEVRSSGGVDFIGALEGELKDVDPTTDDSPFSIKVAAILFGGDDAEIGLTSTYRIVDAIETIKATLSRLNRLKNELDRSLMESGVDPRTWSPGKSGRPANLKTIGLLKMIETCKKRLLELELAKGEREELDRYYDELRSRDRPAEPAE